MDFEDDRPRMRYEHLAQINDPQLAFVERLTVSQVWRGLVRRIEHAVEFSLALERCVVLERRVAPGAITLERALDFGVYEVRDTVTLVPEHSIDIQVHPDPRWPAARMRTQIEAPTPDSLFLRFIYDWEASDAPATDPGVHEARRQAYRASDLDAVRRIRELAAAGELG